jgi:hypothetical protein
MKPADWVALSEKNLINNIWNHSFSPCHEGPVFCIWERKDEITSEQFQAFINGPDSPASRQVFQNKARRVSDAFLQYK